MIEIMHNYVIEFPEYFDEYAAEIRAKGYFNNLTIVFGEQRLRVTIYDPVPLEQDCRDEVASEVGYFAVTNLLVVPSVTRTNIEAAVERLGRGDFRDILNIPAPR